MCRANTPHLKASHFEKYNYNIFNVWWLTQFSETKAICLSCLKTYYYHSRTTQKSRSELCHFKFIKHTWFDTNIEEQTSWNLHTFLLLFVLLWNFLHSAQVAFKYHKRKLYCTQGTVRESGTDFLSFSAEKHGGQYLRSGDCDEPGMCILRKHVPHSSVLMFWR